MGTHIESIVKANLMKEKIRLILSMLLLLASRTDLVCQTIPNYLPKEGLVAWYPFDGVADDRSGNGNHLRINGPVLTADRQSNA